MKFANPLPTAKFVGSKNRTMVRLCRDKTVLHLGFVDEGLLEDRLQQDNWLHAAIARSASKLVGVDISAEGVRRAQQLGFSDCYAGNVEQLDSVPFPRLNYDIVLAPDIIEHVANPGLFLSELQKVVTEDSVVVISTPNALSFKTLFFPIVKTEVVHPDHNCYFSPTTLTTLLRKHGFRVTDIGLYSDVWVPSRRSLSKPGSLIGKSIFTAMDFVLRYSFVPLFPYFSEGMVVEAKTTRRPNVEQTAEPAEVTHACS